MYRTLLRGLFLFLLVFLIGKAATLDTAKIAPYGGVSGVNEITVDRQDGFWAIPHTRAGYFQRGIFSLKSTEKVRFINHSEKPLALGFAAVVPGQTLPAPAAPLASEGYFDVSFTDRGIWKYFDTANPADFGILYVAK